jgi:hypothetical protein
VLTTPTLTTTSTVDALNAVVILNGAVQTLATGLTINVANGAQNAGAVIGAYVGQDVVTGKIMVSGTITAQFDATTIQTLKDAKTAVSLTAYLPCDASATSDFVCINLPRVKIFTDTPDDGEKAILRTYNFVAEYNATGGTGISSEQTIMSIQDSAA